MDNLEYERKFYSQGEVLVAGVDEVGRGPLAGPLVCAAVIMPKDSVIDGITDSKKLSPKKREYYSEVIKKQAIAYSIVEVSEKIIDEINILNAVKRGMENAVKGLSVKPQAVIVDGLDTHLNLGCDKTEYVIKGDLKSYNVACASIIAKVYRDALMVEFADKYPEYSFEKHKGYGTKEHIDKIKEIGPCDIHRRTFIKNFWAEQAKNGL